MNRPLDQLERRRAMVPGADEAHLDICVLLDEAGVTQPARDLPFKTRWNNCYAISFENCVQQLRNGVDMDDSRGAIPISTTEVIDIAI